MHRVATSYSRVCAMSGFSLKKSLSAAAVMLLGCLFFTRLVFPAKIFDKAAKKQLTTYLYDICEWIMAREQASHDGQIRSVAGDPFSLQGNLARVLIAGSELTKNGSRFLEEALRWCDRFASQQQRVVTSQGKEGGYWPSAQAGTVALAENSFAAAALARACEYADAGRRKNYRQVLERYALFLLEGTQLPGHSSQTGWIITQGDDAGALGTGTEKAAALAKPSTASTAGGASFFAQLYAVSRNRQHRDQALKSLEWLLKNRRPNGEVINFTDGKESDAAAFTAVTLFAEAVQSASYLLEDASFNERLGTDLENTVRQMMRIQAENGLWGEGPDRRGSSGVATLLAWYYLSFKADETIPQSLDKFWQNLSNPVHAQSFGVLLHPISTAWMGLTTAEMIKPGITFKKQ